MDYLTELTRGEDVSVSTSSAQSSAAPSNTTHARISADVVVRFRRGANPTALTTDMRLPAEAVEIIPCAPGEKVAGIAASAGTMNVTFLGG